MLCSNPDTCPTEATRRGDVAWFEANWPVPPCVNNAYDHQCHYMDLAASNNRLDLLKWFHANTTETCSWDAMTFAALYGHFDVVKWLRANRNELHPYSRHCMRRAIERGFLEMARYVHVHCDEVATPAERGLRFVEYVAEHGRLNVIEWTGEALREDSIARAIDAAGACGHREIAQWLQDRDCSPVFKFPPSQEDPKER